LAELVMIATPTAVANLPTTNKQPLGNIYIKLTSAISMKKIENYVNFNLFFRGYKKDVLDQPITRE
jgi:hypothetical protein